MGVQESADVARESVEAFNAADWERYAAAFAPDAVYEEPGTQRRAQGVEEVVTLNKGWKDAFPDARGTITNAFATDDSAALEITWTGTQSGPLQSPGGDIPASNRSVVIKAAQVMTIEDGKIKENQHYFDMMGMLEQLGVTE
jgi:steroid delta-isomerase-like uncharacterized protein